MALVAVLRWCLMMAGLAGAASVEAGSLMNVTIDAPLFDTSLAAGGGCDPAGCRGVLTRVSRDDCVYVRDSST